MCETIPWWESLRLRDEIANASGVVDDDVQMQLYRVAYDLGGKRPKYARPSYYGEITYPTSQLTELLARIAIRLSGERGGDALIQLNQSMGGGKSHACVGAYHLAKSPQGFWATEIGEAVLARGHSILGRDLQRSLGDPHVVVLSCDNMTPGETSAADGPVARSLYERFLWRLVDGDMTRFDTFCRDFGSKAGISNAIQSAKRPVLIIIDEIINYIGRGLGGANDAVLTNQDMAFLRALTEAVKDTPRTVALVVLISSDKDTTALDAPGQARREELERDLKRNGRARAVNENTDFAEILRRRLFSGALDPQAIDGTICAHHEIMTTAQWREKVFERLNESWVKNFAEQVRRTYPFHPQLMTLAEQEWANLAGFQKVRDTIKIFAAGVYALSQRAARGEWVPTLIGPGDIPLSDAASRDALLHSGLLSDAKTAANYRSLAQNDVVNLAGTAGTARTLDTERKPSNWTAANPRAAERGATAIFVTSIVGARRQNRRGAGETEVLAAMAVPDRVFEYADADGVLKELIDPERGLTTVEVIPGRSGQHARYFMSTRQRLPMLIRAMRNTITDDDRDAAIADCVPGLLKHGPFQQTIFVLHDRQRTPWQTLEAAELDRPRVTRLIALDPCAFTVRNGDEVATHQAVEAFLGVGHQARPVTWASSAVFAVASAHGRAQARGLAAEYVAHQRVIDTTDGADENDFLLEATPARDEALQRLRTAVIRAFTNVLYLAQPEITRVCENVALGNGQSALRGDDVWTELTDRQKVFAQQDFSVQALLYNLRDSDYGRPLPEIRDAFWNAPRLPLLPSGEMDLRNALYDAVHDGKLRIVRGDGEEVVVTHPSEINFSSQGLSLQRPAHTAPADGTGEDTGQSSVHVGSAEESKAASPTHKEPGGRSASRPEKQLAFVINKNLVADPDSAGKLGEFLRELWVAMDDGDATYVLAQMSVVINADRVHALEEKARNSGITVTVTDR